MLFMVFFNEEEGINKMKALAEIPGVIYQVEPFPAYQEWYAWVEDQLVKVARHTSELNFNVKNGYGFSLLEYYFFSYEFYLRDKAKGHLLTRDCCYRIVEKYCDSNRDYKEISINDIEEDLVIDTVYCKLNSIADYTKLKGE